MKKRPRQQKDSYIAQASEQYKWTILLCDIVIEANIYYGDKRIRDIDNYNKLWMDALSGILYKDDKQIIGLMLYKHYDKENPRIIIDVKWVI
jgi:Holliday junction resolvase RusA-like endonuclease